MAIINAAAVDLFFNFRRFSGRFDIQRTKTGAEMSTTNQMETREDGYVKNAKTGRWLKPGGRAYTAYVAGFLVEPTPAGNVAMAAAAVPVVDEPKAKAKKVAKPRAKKAAADDVAPELSDHEDFSTLNVADFDSGLKDIQEKLKTAESFAYASDEPEPEPEPLKVRKPRKPRAKKVA